MNRVKPILIICALPDQLNYDAVIKFIVEVYGIMISFVAKDTFEPIKKGRRLIYIFDNEIRKLQSLKNITLPTRIGPYKSAKRLHILQFKIN